MIKGYIELDDGATLNAPKLQIVKTLEFLYIGYNVTIIAPELQGFKAETLYISSKLPIHIEKGLWKYNKESLWWLDNKCSKYLLSRKGKHLYYAINGIELDRPFFDKVRKGKLTVNEAIAIEKDLCRAAFLKERTKQVKKYTRLCKKHGTK